MIGFFNDANTPVSDNLLFGQHALTNNVGGVGTINHVEIKHCKARHIFATSNTSASPTTTPPTTSTWLNTHIMNDDLGHNLQAGNAGRALAGLTSLLIRRKIADDISAPWVTVFDIPVDSDSVNDGIYFTVKDYFVRSGTTYIYSVIPLIYNGSDIQQGAVNPEIIHVSVTPKFDSIFICSRTGFQRLMGTLSYDDLSTVQLTGVHETLGSQYPIVVANSQVNYQTGGVSATILNKEFLENMQPQNPPRNSEGNIVAGWTNPTEFNREKLRLAREEFESFITDRTPKVIKDMNGNMWLVMITDTPTYSFYSNWGMGLGDIHFSWTQIGDVDNEADMEAAGMIGGINTED